MNLFPDKIYESFRRQKIDKSRTIDLLITLIENIDDDIIRRESVDILSKLDVQHNKIFKILENILISDSNENLRYSAAKVIKTKFLKKSLIPFFWALRHESSYNCLITIIKSLEEISDNRIISMLLGEIKKIRIEEFKNSLTPSFESNIIEQYSHKKLAEILINHITIKYLKKKFDKINFKIEQGFVVELNFSKVDNQIINWRDRDALRDNSEIIGIENLKYLKKIELFPLQWAINNEYTYKSSIALIKALERLNNDFAKNAIISQINKIDDKIFSLSIANLLRLNQKIETFSLSKLSDILRNYLSISFFKKKYPSMKYEVANGEIVTIQIEKESLITLPEFIKFFRSLRNLILKECKLYSLPESIGFFVHLEVLDLEGNNLKAIPTSISSLRSLRLLNLSNNQIQKISYSIGQLTSLQHLNLESNNLTDLPKSIGYLVSLKYLHIGRNNLNKIPSSIGSLKSLQSLNLSLNKLKYLPQSIGLLYSLEYLNIDNNNLTTLPSSINSISSLKILSIEENELLGLPESMELLKSLEVLKLGWNKIEKLPNSIGALVSLKYLRLTSNKLHEFPETVCSLSSLEFMDASRNKIKILPEEIGNLISLQILKLSDNQLKKLSDSICSLYSLKILNLSENNIVNLPESIGSLLSLKEIWLNGNKLNNLPHSIGKLNSLEKLKLNNNQLTNLPKSIENLGSLEEFSLNWDRIENIADLPGFIKNLA